MRRYEPILLFILAYSVSSPTRHRNCLWSCNSMIATLNINRSVSNSDLDSMNFILIIVWVNISVDSERFSVKLLFVISKYLPYWIIYICMYVCIQLCWVSTAFSGLSLVAESKGYSLGAVHWLLIVVTSLLGILVPGPGIESMFPALAGIFLTTGLPGKSVPHCDF